MIIKKTTLKRSHVKKMIVVDKKMFFYESKLMAKKLKSKDK